MSKPRTYKVWGHAVVPVEVEIHVEAVSEAEALEKSRAVFKKEKRRCVIDGTADLDSVYDFEPREANTLK